MHDSTSKQRLRAGTGCRVVEISTNLSGRATSAARGPLLELLQAAGEELGLLRVGDGAALEQSAEHDAGPFELVHVLEDEELHLPRPQRHAGRARLALDGRRIAPRERQVLQAV